MFQFLHSSEVPSPPSPAMISFVAPGTACILAESEHCAYCMAVLCTCAHCQPQLLPDAFYLPAHITGYLFSQLPVSLRLRASILSCKFGWNQPPSSNTICLPCPFHHLSKIDRQCDCISLVSFGSITKKEALCRVAYRYITIRWNKQASILDKPISIWEGQN